jgi:hypothetical protein
MIVPDFRLSERGWLHQLIGTYAYRGLTRTGGLFRMFGWTLIFHDEATNAPRQCPSCKAAIYLPRNPPGFPDILAIRGDTLLVAELKSDRGRVSPEQHLWLEAFRAVRRIVVVVWRPRDVDTAVEVLR